MVINIYDINNGKVLTQFVGDYDLDPTVVGHVRVISYTINRAYGETVYMGSTNLVGAIATQNDKTKE